MVWGAGMKLEKTEDSHMDMGNTCTETRHKPGPWHTALGFCSPWSWSINQRNAIAT